LLALTYLKNDQPPFRAVERKYREFWLFVLMQGEQAVSDEVDGFDDPL